MPTTTTMGNIGLNPYGPYNYFQGVLQRGAFSVPQQQQILSQARQYGATNLRSQQQDIANRGAATGYLQPWMMRGGYAGQGLNTLAAQQAATGLLPQMHQMNVANQMQAGGQLGNLATALAQMQMTPTRPDQTPDYITNAMSAYQQYLDMMNQYMQGLPGLFGNFTGYTGMPAQNYFNYPGGNSGPNVMNFGV